MTNTMSFSYHSISHEVLDRPLNRPHVHPAGEPQVLVEQVAVPVLLRGPRAVPHGPGASAGARVVLGALKPDREHTRDRFNVSRWLPHLLLPQSFV